MSVHKARTALPHVVEFEGISCFFADTTQKRPTFINPAHVTDIVPGTNRTAIITTRSTTYVTASVEDVVAALFPIPHMDIK